MKLVYQKETFIDQANWGIAFNRFFPTVFAQRCPVCLSSSLFKNLFELKESCSSCQAVFERDKGSAILSAAISYFAVIVLCLLMAFPIILIFGFFEGITFVFVAIVLALIFLLHRPVKGLYIWTMWCFGFVYPNKKVQQPEGLLNPENEKPKDLL